MRKYTLVRDEKDDRDFKLSRLLAPSPKVKLPPSFDPRVSYPPVLDQGTLGSCTANAGITARAMLAKDKNLSLSRLFLYYKERELRGTINEDSGASIRDICKALSKAGVCHESLMPYNIEQFATPPSEQALTDALDHKVVSYYSVNTIDDIKSNIALRQQPVLIGMTVYKSFESEAVAKTGIATLPGPNEEALGGHAVLIVGYKVIKNVPCFIVRNSWGSKWGDKGYFYLPFEFITRKLAYDSWTLV